MVSHIVMAKPTPPVANALSPGAPPWRQVCNFDHGTIEANCFAHRDYPPVLGRIGCAAEESPRIVILIVNDAQNGQTLPQHLSGRDAGDIWSLIEGPASAHRSDLSEGAIVPGLAEQSIDVTRAVQDADDFDSVLVRAIDDEMITEPLERERSQSRVLRMLKLARRADARPLGKQAATVINLLEKPKRGFNAVLGDARCARRCRRRRQQ
jgi:hypothetical protein